MNRKTIHSRYGRALSIWSGLKNLYLGDRCLNLIYRTDTALIQTEAKVGLSITSLSAFFQQRR
jgi:hypothetical protein